MNPLYLLKQVQDPFKSVPPLSVIPINLSQSFSPLLRKDGSESGNSHFLFPAIPSAKKETKVMPSNRSFPAKSVYKQTAFQDGDSQVSKTVDNGQ